MSSEETCLQGFPSDDIFDVIVFALVQIKDVGLRQKRKIAVERKRGNPAKRNVTDVQISRLNIVDKGHAQTNKIGCGCSRHQLLINNYSLLISKEDCL